MPRRVDEIDQFNYIIAFIMDPCDAPIQVWARAAFPAVMMALVEYYAIDLTNVFTGYVRPVGPLKAGRSGRHGARKPDKTSPKEGERKKKGGKRTWVKKLKSWVSFDPDEWAASHLPMAGEVGARTVTPGVATTWEMYGLEQRFMYWVMLYEIAEGAIYRTVHGVGTSWYCQQQYRPWVYTERDVIADPGVPGGAGILLPEPIKARFGSSGPGNDIYVISDSSECILKAKRADASNGRGYKLKLIHTSGVVFESNEANKAGDEMIVHGIEHQDGSWYCVFDAGGIGAGYDLKATCIGSSADAGPITLPPAFHYPDGEKASQPPYKPGPIDDWFNALVGNNL